ncbi:uncharacterized protein PHACADRAFT_207789, partial [Phanerochaete carnosa HHB-10118-sp]
RGLTDVSRGRYLDEHPGGQHLSAKFICRDATTALFWQCLRLFECRSQLVTIDEAHHDPVRRHPAWPACTDDLTREAAPGRAVQRA